ncbi:methyltransferase [Chloroflexi bacterium TSY]|nr:methyltransferase [Chloroflexi bacterium TSY]
MPVFEDEEAAAILLAEQLVIAPDATLYDFHCGSGLVGCIAGTLAPEGRIFLTDANVIPIEAARWTLASNDVTNGELVCSHGRSHLSDQPAADIVTLHLPKGKQPALQLIWDGFQLLKPNGRLYLAGANRSGIKTQLRYMEELFGNSQVLAYRQGCRVGMAVKLDQNVSIPEIFSKPWLDHQHYHRFEIDHKGESYTICGKPGVFSWDRVDGGTERLLRVMEIDPTDRVLDLGCGYGILGVIAARSAREGTVTMVDANIIAVESARQTVAANGCSNCQVHLSDCAQAICHQAFDVVLSNAPFHQAKSAQYDVAHQFIDDAATVLKPNGRFYLVANRFLPYEARMKAQFASVQTVFQDAKFKVLLGIQSLGH